MKETGYEEDTGTKQHRIINSKRARQAKRSGCRSESEIYYSRRDQGGNLKIIVQSESIRGKNRIANLKIIIKSESIIGNEDV